MKVLVVGANNSGKGTLVKLLKKKTGLPTIGCSSILSQEGLDIATGALLPDEAVNSIMQRHLIPKDCYILDGYPRTLVQNEFMKQFCVPDLIVVLNISEEEVLHRAVGRRICDNCGEIYNLNGFKVPENQNICDNCGGSLLHREDDKEAAVKRRYQEYMQMTYPIVDAYKEAGSKTVVLEFDATEGCEKVASSVADYINNNKK